MPSAARSASTAEATSSTTPPMSDLWLTSRDRSFTASRPPAASIAAATCPASAGVRAIRPARATGMP